MSALPTPAQLAPALSRAASPLLFALAGRVAAQALVVGTWQRDTDMIRLLDAMERQMPEVVRALSEHVHGPVLVECTGAMAVLALARPHTERGVRQVSRAIVDRTPPSAWIADSELLPLRGLLALSAARDELARDTAAELDARGDEAGSALVRWVAGQRARNQRADRLRALRVLARRFPGSVHPMVLAAAAFALPESRGLRPVASFRRERRSLTP